MEFFETVSPAIIFYIYVALGIVTTLILKTIFKKSPTYYTIFISTATLFACFSREFYSTLPLDIMDVPRIISKFVGISLGILFISLWSRQRKTRRKLA
jgi:L-cystine uptake protein TcyP (sodium:dicarboxylate symporter family)